jgi:hypothetical protein
MKRIGDEALIFRKNEHQRGQAHKSKLPTSSTTSGNGNVGPCHQFWHVGRIDHEAYCRRESFEGTLERSKMPVAAAHNNDRLPLMRICRPEQLKNCSRQVVRICATHRDEKLLRASRDDSLPSAPPLKIRPKQGVTRTEQQFRACFPARIGFRPGVKILVQNEIGAIWGGVRKIIDTDHWEASLLEHLLIRGIKMITVRNNPISAKTPGELSQFPSIAQTASNIPESNDRTVCLPDPFLKWACALRHGENEPTAATLPALRQRQAAHYVSGAKPGVSIGS